ncbi:MAG: ATP synthase F1 subunit epsilon [Chloroflexi bacterium]|nr:ATP synthase F1 subunit epsilon [Chloroflexota bacterium]|tara:strand:- start:741 stop:1166 length:426 start_codon:yes stop_codon:yes gene_type:complete
MSKLNLKITTAESEVFSGEVDSITLPASEGEITVLPSHVKIISSISPGELRLKIDNEEQFLSISGGFVQVNNDLAIILADSAERDSEIDIERAEEALKRAKERLDNSESEVDLLRSIQSMRRATIRVKIGKKRNSNRRRNQ